MRRVAAFLNINIPAAHLPVVVDRCTFDRMRADADKVGNFHRVFEGGAKSFLFKGINGRWREVLTEGELQRYRHRVEELLAPEAAYWLEHGSLLPGSRPRIDASSPLARPSAPHAGDIVDGAAG
jgi:aryl sulfotransferase